MDLNEWRLQEVDTSNNNNKRAQSLGRHDCISDFFIKYTKGKENYFSKKRENVCIHIIYIKRSSL